MPYTKPIKDDNAFWHNSGRKQFVSFIENQYQDRNFVTDRLYRIGELLSLHESKAASLVERAIQFIYRSYDNDSLSITELASQLGISRYTLSDAFMKIKGISPLEYLVRYRLEKACKYMTHQKLPLNVVAYSVGYKNYDQFGKIFKKYYGISPRVFQADALKKLQSE